MGMLAEVMWQVEALQAPWDGTLGPAWDEEKAKKLLARFLMGEIGPGQIGCRLGIYLPQMRDWVLVHFERWCPFHVLRDEQGRWIAGSACCTCEGGRKAAEAAFARAMSLRKW